MSEEQKTTSSQSSAEQAKAILAKMFEELCVTAEISIMQDNKLGVATEEPGRLIGKKGQTLECLELLLNRILKKNDDSSKHTPWVTIDVDGYCVAAPVHETERPGRLPKEEIERLHLLACDVAKEVRKFGHPRVIGPFSPAERRIIHLALENDPQVETISDPEADANRRKKITIRLKNA